MKQIKADGVALAFNTNAVENVTVVMRSQKEFYLTFDAYDPQTKTQDTYALLTRRGDLKTWADPRLLFAFLQKTYNVHSCRIIFEEVTNETESTPGGSSG